MSDQPGGRGVAVGRVITASDRAATGEYPDRSGPVLVDGLRRLGFQVPDAAVVPDGDPVGDALARAVTDGVHVVLTTGGTGVAPADRTPEATRPLLDRELPGVAEAIRAHGTAKGVATAALSRGLAGMAGHTVVVNVPGSTGACRDALAVLGPLLPHLVHEATGGACPLGVPHDGPEPAEAGGHGEAG